jgi:ribulose-5-phosphate 4-epimerase/fuculose-1-phosphate aldolase
MPDTHLLSSVRSRVSPLEWQARLDCAALYRLMAHFGQTDLIFNHITLRVPGEGNRILINPYGWMYEEITASSLVTIDLNGNEVLNPHGPDASVNFAGYVIHSAIHGARDDVACVIHTHTRAGMAVASMKCGFLPMTQTAIGCFPVAYHDYEGPAVDVAERERLVDHLGSANFLVLRNHGLLVCNKTAAGAFRSIHQFEAACQAQVDAMPRGGASGEMPLLVPETIVAASVERRRIAMAKRPSVELHWPAMLRLLDRRDPSWRD